MSDSFVQKIDDATGLRGVDAATGLPRGVSRLPLFSCERESPRPKAVASSSYK